MDIKKATELLQAFGWVSIESRNPVMYSFSNDDGKRLNWYFTTGTITIQSDKGYFKAYRNILTLEQLEAIL